MKRERQAKIDICRNFPAVRRKREIDFATVGSLRVNPEITPPPDTNNQENLTDELTNNLKELGIEEEVQLLIEQIHKVTATALTNAKLKHCNTTKNGSGDNKKADLKEIIYKVNEYARAVVQNALTNMTVFCDDANSMEKFQIGRCQWGPNSRCPVYFRSTMPGPVKYSTQHRPLIRQSTKHEGRGIKHQYVPWLRSQNGTEEKNLTRAKRDANQTDAGPANETVKEVLRMATRIMTDKKVDFAPVRRSYQSVG